MIALWLYISLLCGGNDWGFFGHRLINRVAVYTLPSEMLGWYKPNIDYLSEHAVDPDKRRYATKHEAVRHYMDLDHWGTLPFSHVPRHWDEALALNMHVWEVKNGDSITWLAPIPHEQWHDTILEKRARTSLVRQYYLKQYYEDEKVIPCDSLQALFPNVNCTDGAILHMDDALSEHGIVPYHLVSMQRRLTQAFRDKNPEAIMRVSAELGHYIGDACVPLHTTTNYNGQLTDQVGIHAFWESRIPELFAVDEFDMVVGAATYIDDPVSYFWGLVLDSHKEVDRVLQLEKELRITFPSDQQICFEDRLNTNVRTQCAEFARAYHLAMDKMVEDRFRVAVKAIGNAWYTAWVDGGQPPPPVLVVVNKRTAEDEELDKALQSGKGKGRDHEN